MGHPHHYRAAIETNRWTLSAGLGALAVVLRLPTFTTRLFDPDEAAIGVQAMVVRSGGTLYRDIFDRKPPLPPLLYAASFAATDSNDVRIMRLVVTALLALAGIVVAVELLRSVGPRAAWIGGLLMITGAMALFPADAGAANYAHIALLPGTAAIVWSRRGTMSSAALAGVAIGAAILSRQSWLLGVVPGCISVGTRGRWRNVVPFLGAAAAAVLTTGFYAPLGKFWEWNVTNSPGFVFAGANLGTAAASALASVGGFVMFHPVITAGVVLAAASAVRQMRRRMMPTDIDLWVWVAVGLAAWAAGLRFFGHYWLQVLPPLVLLAAPTIARWSDRASKIGIVAVAVPAIVAWSLLFVPGSFHHRPNARALAEYIDKHTAATQRVFVWGSYPEVFVAADRLPSGGLVHTDFVVGRSGGREDPAQTMQDAVPEARTIMLDSLRRNPPELVVDTSTATDLGYQKYPMTLVPQLDQFVRDGYTKLTVIHGVTVWQRRSDAGQSA